jgi:1-acyl-sn-glycerol-3-phosphate acyltransferase
MPDKQGVLDKSMFRTTIVLAWTILATMFFGINSILASFMDNTGNIAHKVARIWAASILRVSGIRVRLKGLKSIDPSKSYIYMANHQSNFDIPVLLAHLPVQFRWLAKAELFKIPLFGLAMKRVGYISIDRSDFRSAVKSLKKAAETIRKGTSVVIFPEGTRSLDGKIHDFKKGGFIMAIDSKVPIVPVVIHGTRAIMPKATLRIWTNNNVLIEIKKPIPTSEFTRKSKDILMENVRKSICESFDKKEVAV